MNAIRTSGTTDPNGTLTLRVPIGRPNTEFEAIVVLQPKAEEGASKPPAGDPWAGADAIRERLAASGRIFSDSAELIREDRDR